MENNKVNVIYFSTNHDSIGLRFLSNNSVYPFVLDNKRWPTVTHYIYAKRFEGTRLEDEIREAPTIFQAKKLATKYKYVTEIDPVTEKEIKCKGYGKNHSYRIREDWRENEERHMKNAISAKFTKRLILRKKLLATGEAKLVDKTNPLTGKILQELRSDLRIRDINFPTVNSSDENKIIFSSLIYTISKVAHMEGWKEIYEEMIVDAIHILSTNKIANQILKCRLAYIEKCKVKRLNNYNKLIEDIQNNLPSKMNFPNQYVNYLTSVFAWYHNLASEFEKKNFLKRAKNIHSIEINLIPGKRFYREIIPPKFMAK